MTRSLAIAVLASALAVAACGDDERQSSTPTGPGGSGAAGGADGGMGGATGGAGGGLATGGAGGSGAQGGGGGVAAFALTSPAFDDGTMIPDAHTCDGANISPALDWTAGPAGTQSYAIVFEDETISFLHSVIWDIPAATLALPEDVDKVYEPPDVPGAKQAIAYSGTRGYAGPCSPATINTYTFTLHALNTAELGLDTTTTRQAARTAIEAASLGTTTLSGLH